MSEKHRQVYSSDAKLNSRCPTCKELVPECQCRADKPVDLAKIKAVLSIEKAGRSGKTVTVVRQLPTSSSFLKDLLKDLKQSCGAGGTSGVDAKGQGFVEVQGDHRDGIRKQLVKKGITVKN